MGNESATTVLEFLGMKTEIVLSYLILKKCWRTSWVGSSTDEVVLSLQEILDQFPGGGGTPYF